MAAVTHRNLLRNAHKLTATKIEHSHWSQSTSRIGYKKSNEFMSSLVCWSMHKPWMYRADVDVKTTSKPWFCGLEKSLIPGQGNKFDSLSEQIVER